MPEHAGRRADTPAAGSRAETPLGAAPGKQTLVEQIGPPVQLRASSAAPAQDAATDGAQATAPGPAAPRGDSLQRAFGQPNRTGLPDGLTSGIESLSGVSMDPVRVHYNSSEPSKVNALAYAQGSDIHLGPGQEQHLPHEAWHVVQQAQGRVSPTLQTKGGAEIINDDHGLEHEADVMGERAAQMGEHAPDAHANAAGSDASAGSAPSAAPVQRRIDGKIIQRVLATVNPQNGPVTLHQAGGVGGGFTIMQNPTQPAGEDVNNTVGFTGVMNGAEWAGLGKSSNEYWRAHAYANSFGGAGGVTNVGWWTADAETRWTGFEQQVRGAGVAAIPDWTPGTGEQGTYLVTRDMYPQITFVDRYIDDLMLGVNWGFADARPAWTRALATCDTITSQKEKEKRIAALKEGRAGVIAANRGRIQNWVNALFGGANSVETNLIKRMTMAYTINTAGANPGTKRASVNQTVNSPQPKPKDFGLKNEPQNIWQELVNHNTGVFGHGNPPSDLMRALVPYAERFKPAQELRAHADGFGVA
ncbi:MAG TPA: DUF4157 domain-containing protein [Kofleriaceae bacterium]|nr:DUF4157 domain-containing protein [Kofleriaceae bacterium]